MSQCTLSFLVGIVMAFAMTAGTEKVFAEAESLARQHLTTAPQPDYGSFQPLGDLRIEFEADISQTREYRRELDLDRAVVAGIDVADDPHPGIGGQYAF